MEESVQAQLELTQQQLEMVLAIDRIRDRETEPEAMLTAIVRLLAEQLQADLCLLTLINQETGQPELKAVNDHNPKLAPLVQELDRTLARKASQLDKVTIWPGEEFLSPESRADLPDQLQLAAVPIIMGQADRLGALLLIRARPPFSPAEVQLLQTAEAQIDSAVMQGYSYHQLQQHLRELKTIYRIDNIRDRGMPFDEMLTAILKELLAAIEAEMGFVMLYDYTGQRLEMRAATHDDLFPLSPHYPLVEQAANESLQQASLICRSDINHRLHSIMCLPLILNEEIIGVLGVVNGYGPSGFTTADRRLLSAIGSQMDTAIFESRERRRLRRVLGRSVDPRIMERLLADPDVDFLKGERMVLTVLYADIRGSTSLAERTEPEQLVAFINDYLEQMTDVILAHKGTLDKFVGDEVMALFGAPFPQPDHALRAIRAGLELQARYRQMVDLWRERGLAANLIGVGIATGEMIVGEMGSPQRTDFSVIGKAANLGSRICSVAEGGQVLISPATYELVQGQVEAEPVPGMRFKGVAHPVTVYQVNRVLA